MCEFVEAGLAREVLRPPKDPSSTYCVEIYFSSINKICGTNPLRYVQDRVDTPMNIPSLYTRLIRSFQLPTAWYTSNERKPDYWL